MPSSIQFLARHKNGLRLFSTSISPLQTESHTSSQQLPLTRYGGDGLPTSSGATGSHTHTLQDAKKASGSAASSAGSGLSGLTTISGSTHSPVLSSHLHEGRLDVKHLDVTHKAVTSQWSPDGNHIAVIDSLTGMWLLDYSVETFEEDGILELTRSKENDHLITLPQCLGGEVDPKLFKYISWSPLGTCLVVFINFETHTPEGSASSTPPHNLHIFKVFPKGSPPAHTASFTIRRPSSEQWPVLKWRDDEMFCCLATRNEILVCDGTSPSTVLYRYSVPRVFTIEIAPSLSAADGKLVVASFSVASLSGEDARFMVWEVNLSAFKPGSTHTSLKSGGGNSIEDSKGVVKCVIDQQISLADSVHFGWSPSGGALLVMANFTIDVAGENYDGVGDCWFVRADGSQVMKLSTKVAQDAQWSPVRDEFILIEGKSPSDINLYNKHGKLKFSFPKGYRNTIRWCPFGMMVAIGGFGNLAGDLSFWYRDSHTQSMQLIAELREPCTVLCEWAPSGTHFLTASTYPRMKIDNCFKIWSYEGERVFMDNFEELYSVKWRPSFEGVHSEPCRPTPRLTNGRRMVFKPKNSDGSLSRFIRGEIDESELPEELRSERQVAKRKKEKERGASERAQIKKYEKQKDWNSDWRITRELPASNTGIHGFDASNERLEKTPTSVSLYSSYTTSGLTPSFSSASVSPSSRALHASIPSHSTPNDSPFNALSNSSNQSRMLLEDATQAASSSISTGGSNASSGDFEAAVSASHTAGTSSTLLKNSGSSGIYAKDSSLSHFDSISNSVSSTNYQGDEETSLRFEGDNEHVEMSATGKAFYELTTTSSEAGAKAEINPQKMKKASSEAAEDLAFNATSLYPSNSTQDGSSSSSPSHFKRSSSRKEDAHHSTSSVLVSSGESSSLLSLESSSSLQRSDSIADATEDLAKTRLASYSGADAEHGGSSSLEPSSSAKTLEDVAASEKQDFMSALLSCTSAEQTSTNVLLRARDEENEADSKGGVLSTQQSRSEGQATCVSVGLFSPGKRSNSSGALGVPSEYSGASSSLLPSTSSSVGGLTASYGSDASCAPASNSPPSSSPASSSASFIPSPYSSFNHSSGTGSPPNFSSVPSPLPSSSSSLSSSSSASSSSRQFTSRPSIVTPSAASSRGISLLSLQGGGASSAATPPPPYGAVGTPFTHSSSLAPQQSVGSSSSAASPTTVRGVSGFGNVSASNISAQLPPPPPPPPPPPSFTTAASASAEVLAGLPQNSTGRKPSASSLLKAVLQVGNPPGNDGRTSRKVTPAVWAALAASGLIDSSSLSPEDIQQQQLMGGVSHVSYEGMGGGVLSFSGGGLGGGVPGVPGGGMGGVVSSVSAGGMGGSMPNQSGGGMGGGVPGVPGGGMGGGVPGVPGGGMGAVSRMFAQHLQGKEGAPSMHQSAAFLAGSSNIDHGSLADISKGGNMMKLGNTKAVGSNNTSVSGTSVMNGGKLLSLEASNLASVEGSSQSGVESSSLGSVDREGNLTVSLNPSSSLTSLDASNTINSSVLATANSSNPINFNYTHTLAGATTSHLPPIVGMTAEQQESLGMDLHGGSAGGGGGKAGNLYLSLMSNNSPGVGVIGSNRNSRPMSVSEPSSASHRDQTSPSMRQVHPSTPTSSGGEESRSVHEALISLYQLLQRAESDPGVAQRLHNLAQQNASARQQPQQQIKTFQQLLAAHQKGTQEPVATSPSSVSMGGGWSGNEGVATPSSSPSTANLRKEIQLILQNLSSLKPNTAASHDDTQKSLSNFLKQVQEAASNRSAQGFTGVSQYAGGLNTRESVAQQHQQQLLAQALARGGGGGGGVMPANRQNAPLYPGSTAHTHSNPPHYAGPLLQQSHIGAERISGGLGGPVAASSSLQLQKIPANQLNTTPHGGFSSSGVAQAVGGQQQWNIRNATQQQFEKKLMQLVKQRRVEQMTANSHAQGLGASPITLGGEISPLQFQGGRAEHQGGGGTVGVGGGSSQSPRSSSYNLPQQAHTTNLFSSYLQELSALRNKAANDPETQKQLANLTQLASAHKLHQQQGAQSYHQQQGGGGGEVGYSPQVSHPSHPSPPPPPPFNQQYSRYQGGSGALSYHQQQQGGGFHPPASASGSTSRQVSQQIPTTYNYPQSHQLGGEKNPFPASFSSSSSSSSNSPSNAYLPALLSNISSHHQPLASSTASVGGSLASQTRGGMTSYFDVLSEQQAHGELSSESSPSSIYAMLNALQKNMAASRGDGTPTLQHEVLASQSSSGHPQLPANGGSMGGMNEGSSTNGSLSPTSGLGGGVPGIFRADSDAPLTVSQQNLSPAAGGSSLGIGMGGGTYAMMHPNNDGSSSTNATPPSSLTATMVVGGKPSPPGAAPAIAGVPTASATSTPPPSGVNIGASSSSFGGGGGLLPQYSRSQPGLPVSSQTAEQQQRLVESILMSCRANQQAPSSMPLPRLASGEGYKPDVDGGLLDLTSVGAGGGSAVASPPFHLQRRGSASYLPQGPPIVDRRPLSGGGGSHTSSAAALLAGVVGTNGLPIPNAVASSPAVPGNSGHTRSSAALSSSLDRDSYPPNSPYLSGGDFKKAIYPPEPGMGGGVRTPQSSRGDVAGDHLVINKSMGSMESASNTADGGVMYGLPHHIGRPQNYVDISGNVTGGGMNLGAVSLNESDELLFSLANHARSNTSASPAHQLPGGMGGGSGWNETLKMEGSPREEAMQRSGNARVPLEIGKRGGMRGMSSLQGRGVIGGGEALGGNSPNTTGNNSSGLQSSQNWSYLMPGSAEQLGDDLAGIASEIARGSSIHTTSPQGGGVSTLGGGGQLKKRPNALRDKCWEYVDPHGKKQGPFYIEEMRAWSVMGYFKPYLPVRCYDGDQFVSLEKLYPPPEQPFSVVPKPQPR